MNSITLNVGNKENINFIVWVNNTIARLQRAGITPKYLYVSFDVWNIIEEPLKEEARFSSFICYNETMILGLKVLIDPSMVGIQMKVI